MGGAAGEVGEIEGERDPELDPEVEEIHPGRQYPHHRPPDPVHRDPRAEDLGIGAEGAPPDPVREEDDRLRAGSVFGAREDPPPGSGDPQGAKEARGNRSDLAAKRRPAGLYRRRSRVEDPGLGERRAPLPVFEVFRSGDPEPVEPHAGELGRDPHQLVRGAVGQGGEQGPVDHGEDRRVHSDPERDHQKRGRRVTRVLQQGAESASHLGKRPCPAERGSGGVRGGPATEGARAAPPPFTRSGITNGAGRKFSRLARQERRSSGPHRENWPASLPAGERNSHHAYKPRYSPHVAARRMGDGAARAGPTPGALVGRSGPVHPPLATGRIWLQHRGRRPRNSHRYSPYATAGNRTPALWIDSLGQRG